MPEQNAGSIAVELALKSSSFERQMKQAAAAVKGIDEEFKVSKAEADAAGRKFDELGARSEATGEKLKLQEAACQRYQDRLEELRARLTATAESQDILRDRLETVRRAHAQSEAALKAHAKAGDLDEASMQQLRDETQHLANEEKELQDAYKAGQRTLVATQGGIDRTQSAYNRLRLETAQTRKEADQLNSVLEDTRQRMNKISGAIGKAGNALTLGLTVPILAAATASTKAAVDWENAFADVRKTVDTTEEGYARLADQIIAMSEEIPVAKEEIAGIAAGAGQLGVSEQYIEKFTRVMADLGVSTDLTGDAAATMFAQYANITGMDLNDVDRLGSVIVDLGNNTATTESKIGAMMQRLAGAGAIVGLTDAQIAGISATLSSLGIEAEAGGTAMSTALSQIDSAVISGGRSLNAYAKIAGVSAKEFAQAWQGDPVAALQLFIDGLGKISASGGDVNAALKTVGINEIRMTDMMKRLATSGDMLTQTVKLANTAWNENAALTEEASKRYSTTASQIQIAKNQISNISTTMGAAFLPIINRGLDAVDGFAEKFAILDENVRGGILFGAGAAALTGPVLKAISGVTGSLSTLIKGLQTVKGLGGIAGLFTAIPAAAPVAIAAGAAGVGLLALNWLNANNGLKAYQQTWEDMDFGLNDDAPSEIQAAIDAAIAKTDRVVEISLEISDEQQSLSDMLDGFLEDGRFTRSEENKLARELKAWVNEGIEQAKKNTEAKIEEYNAIWDSIGLTDEQKEAEKDAIIAKSDGYIEELKGYRAEALALIAGLQSGEIEATDDNKKRLDDLLAQITAIKVEIQAASEGIDAFTNEALINRISSGNAREGDIEAAVNLTLDLKNANIANIQEDIRTEIGNLQAALDDAETEEAKIALQAQIDLRWAEEDALIEEEEAKANEALQAIAEGIEVDEETVKAFMDKLNALAMLERYYESEDQEAYAQEIGPKIAEAAKAVFPEMSQEDLDMIAAGMFTGTNFPMALQQALQDQILEQAQSGEFDPLVEYLNLIGSEISAEDLSGLNANLQAAIALVDLKGTGGQISTDLMDGLKLGLTENQTLADEAVKAAGDGLISTLKETLGIASPSTAFQEIGYWSMMGLQQGIMANRALALAPLQLMTINDLPPIGASMMNALAAGIGSDGARQTLIDALIGAVRVAITSAQAEADANPIRVKASLDTSGLSIRSLSRALARM